MKPYALLVNPWIEDFAAYDFWARPLGLLELGAALRASGWEVRLVDCLDVNYPGRRAPLPRRKEDGSGKFDSEVIPLPPPLHFVKHRRFRRYGMPVSEFHRLLREGPRPDAVFVNSVMTYWWTGVRSAITELRKVFPEVPVILGGVYATLLPEHGREAAGADFVVQGDFRRGLPAILRELGLPDSLAEDELFPAWDLYPRISATAIITGRGCPFRCPYCAVSALHPRLSRKAPEAVVYEIERLVRDFKVRDIAFFDDALRAGGDERLAAILERVLRAGLQVRFHAINALHLRGFTRELALLLRKAGFVTLRFGLETVDPERGRELGGKAELSDLYAAAAHLRAAGYGPGEIGVYLLAGLPGQEPQEVERGIEQALRAGARPYLSEYSPVPGSPMWEQAAAASRFDIKTEPLYHNNTLLPCASSRFTYEELERLKRKAREPFKPPRGRVPESPLSGRGFSS